MSKFVIDSSALLACLHKEAGSESVVAALPDALMSAVNFAETIGVLIRQGASPEGAREILGLLEVEVVDFTRSLAHEAGALVQRTRSAGLSLGDRACLALARDKNLPAITADRAWRGIDIGVTIQFIR
jgi:ribonuclease VapC